jgi:hypothetical protein
MNTSSCEHELFDDMSLCFSQDMYDNLSQKIEDVTRNPISFQFEGEFAVFLNTEKKIIPV